MVIDKETAIDTVMKFMPSLLTPDGSGEFDHEIYLAQEMFVDIGQALNALPSAIVRCEECKHLEVYEHPDGRRKEKKVIIYGCGLADGYVPCCHADGFCSEGEPK